MRKKSRRIRAGLFMQPFQGGTIRRGHCRDACMEKVANTPTPTVGKATKLHRTKGHDGPERLKRRPGQTEGSLRKGLEV